jgi:hypothetical protein
MEEIPKLPSYFPLKLKKCAIPADDFFSCFEENTTNVSPNVGNEALLKCSKQLDLYKECMDASMKARKKKKWWIF